MMASCWPFGNMKQDHRDHNAVQSGRMQSIGSIFDILKFHGTCNNKNNDKNTSSDYSNITKTTRSLTASILALLCINKQVDSVYKFHSRTQLRNIIQPQSPREACTHKTASKDESDGKEHAKRLHCIIHMISTKQNTIESKRKSTPILQIINTETSQSKKLLCLYF